MPAFLSLCVCVCAYLFIMYPSLCSSIYHLFLVSLSSIFISLGLSPLLVLFRWYPGLWFEYSLSPLKLILKLSPHYEILWGRTFKMWSGLCCYRWIQPLVELVDEWVDGLPQSHSALTVSLDRLLRCFGSCHVVPCSILRLCQQGGHQWIRSLDLGLQPWAK